MNDSDIFVNRYTLVTGASQGLGAAIARALVEVGHSVMLCARNLEDLEKIKAALDPACREGQKVEISVCDVSDPDQVDQLISKTMTLFPQLDVLVNNAGVYGPMGCLEDIDWDQWVAAININLMGTVYPCRAVLPHFKSRGHGRIINLSGGGATNPLPRISAYAASKAAVVRFTETLALEVESDGIEVNAIAPGALNTRMMTELLAAGPGLVGEDFHAKMVEVSRSGGTPLEAAAGLCAHLASVGGGHVTGRLISAVWDPWVDFAQYSDEINQTDVYTLRRITPKERGMPWGGD